jgi:hypothetical protein
MCAYECATSVHRVDGDSSKFILNIGNGVKLVAIAIWDIINNIYTFLRAIFVNNFYMRERARAFTRFLSGCLAKSCCLL